MKFKFVGGGTQIEGVQAWGMKSDDMFVSYESKDEIKIVILSQPEVHWRMPEEIDINLKKEKKK